MSKEGKFYIFCVEIYKNTKGLSGKEVMELFDKYDVCGFIFDCFGALHVQGELATIQDIDKYIANSVA
ncbi:MAG: DUF3791 domain-containing protein [Firmicutes bacterium]|nr:DUF3791 domain-containing protein [Bacillota bacterium]